MPPFRNYFSRKTGAANGTEPANDENARPGSRDATRNGFTRPEGLGTKSPSALSIKRSIEEPIEYKLSGVFQAIPSTVYRAGRALRIGEEMLTRACTVVNDSGVYLPPSPPEKKSFWHRSPSTTTNSSRTRSALSDNEPFSISRESFESYRRSFDISARSPVVQTDIAPPRQSLDSRSPRYPRSAVNGSGRFARPQTTDEEGFEDVGLNDDVKPKKKGIFSRFTNDTPESPTSTDGGSRPNSSHHGFHLPGRKRGVSGQGAELGNIDQLQANGNRDETVR